MAVGWSTYVADVMGQASITIPGLLYGERHDLVAAAIVLILTAVICVGIKLSSQVSFVFVMATLAVVLLVIVAASSSSRPVTGVVVAVISTFVPLTELAQLVNIGTLFAFVLVAVGVRVLRRTRPDLERAFRCPGVPYVPVLAAVYLMLNLPGATWVRFLIWMAVGFVVYFTYSARHSRLATDPNYSREADAAAASGRETGS